jgi:CRP-like cAMP-binding protein
VRPRNRLLSAVPAAELRGLEPHLERVDVPRGHLLHPAEEPIEFIWFPEAAVVSLRVTLAGGGAADIGTVGREGFVGHAVLLGDSTSIVEAVVQVSGAALCLPASVFQTALAHDGEFRQLMSRSMRAFFLQVALVAVCNRLHTAEQRMARWLLMTHDRVGARELLLTHDLLAEMLGATRSTATLALGSLQQAGYVRTAWGRITILDRAGLESASCECYAATQTEYERLLGGSAGLPTRAQPGTERHTRNSRNSSIRTGRKSQ